jgi:transglutaminase-like putative cysteine protease
MLYSDQRDLVFPMPGFSDSCVLDVRYVVEEDSPVFSASFHLGRELPVRSASYSYRLDEGIKGRGAGIMIRGYNVPRDPQVRNEYSDRLFYVYYLDLSDLPAYPDEPWMPPRDSVVPRVVVGACFGHTKKPDWNGFAKLYNSVLPDLDDPSPAIKELSTKLASGVGDDAGMIRRVSEYVCENIRYVAIDLNESGFRPNDPDAVLENRYGDCKDMSMLAIALLREAGLSAYPALLVTRSSGEIDKELLAPYFNHMIVYVETSRGGKIWLDPTAGVCPLGYLPYEDMGVDALIVKERVGVWQRTPGYTIYPPARRSHTSVIVLSDGGVSGIIRQTYEGSFALSRSHVLDAAAKRELGEVTMELLSGYVPDGEFDEGRTLRASRDSLTLTIAADFSRPSRSFDADGKHALSLDFPEPMVYYLTEINASIERRAPLWFPHGWSEVDTVCIRKPENCTSCAPLDEFDLASVYGSSSLKCTETDSQLVVVRTYSLRADTVGTEDIGDFVEFWEDVRNRSRGRVTFEVASD